MISATTLSLAVLALLIGISIGCVGVGGVLLAPVLAYVGGLDLHLAMATSMWSFLFTGATGTVSYCRRRSVGWRTVGWLSAGVIPAAVVGARTNVGLSSGALTVLLAAVVLAAGVHALFQPGVPQALARCPGTFSLLSIGVVVGFGSALTGTGGPVLLVPILLFVRVPVLPAVGASQVIQLPVAVFATAGYVLYGRVDFALGTVLGLLAVVGVVIGARIAHTVPETALRRVVAVSLIAVGLLIAGRSIAQLG